MAMRVTVLYSNGGSHDVGRGETEAQVMKPRNDDVNEEATRSRLARTVLWMFGVLAIGLLVLLGLERKLGLSSVALGTAQNLVRGVFGLTAMAFIFYFRRPK
jgi:hypothetical protein